MVSLNPIEEEITASPTLKLLLKQSVPISPNRNITPDLNTCTPNDNEVMSPLLLKSKLQEVPIVDAPMSI